MSEREQLPDFVKVGFAMTSLFIISLLLFVCACKKSSPVEPTPEPTPQPPPVVQKFSYSYVPSPKDWFVHGANVSPVYSNGTISFSFSYAPYKDTWSLHQSVIVDVNNSILHDLSRANVATLSFTILPQNVPAGSVLAVDCGTSEISRFSMAFGSAQTIQIPSSYLKSFQFTLSCRFQRTDPATPYQCSLSVTNILLKASE